MSMLPWLCVSAPFWLSLLSLSLRPFYYRRRWRKKNLLKVCLELVLCLSPTCLLLVLRLSCAWSCVCRVLVLCVSCVCLVFVFPIPVFCLCPLPYFLCSKTKKEVSTVASAVSELRLSHDEAKRYISRSMSVPMLRNYSSDRLNIIYLYIYPLNAVLFVERAAFYVEDIEIDKVLFLTSISQRPCFSAPHPPPQIPPPYCS